MPPVDKIKRNFTWLRKVLGIIDKTTMPGTINDQVRVGMDLFGWDLLAEASTMTASGTVGATTVNGVATPEGFLRVVLHAAVNHTDGGASRSCWITKRLASTTNTVGLTVPINLNLLATNPVLNRLILAPGDFLVARATSMGVAAILQLRVNSIDLPIGEYIAPW